MLAPLLLLAALAAPNDNAAPRAAAQAFETAQRQSDGAALGRLLAPDFLFVRGSGRIGNRQDYIAGFTQADDRVTRLDVTDPLFLRAGPDTAIVGGEARIRGTQGGQPFANHYRFSDTLVRRDGRWLVIYAQVTGLGE
jgi:ketosteroid isomerase-like protein